MQRENLFQKLNRDKKLQVIFFAVIILVILGIYFPVTSWIQKNVAEKKVLAQGVESDSNILAQIEEVSVEDGTVNIFGWALKLNAELVDIKAVLKAVDADDVQVLKTSLAESNDLKNYVKYLEVEETSVGSGFTARVKEKELQQDVCYEVLLYLTYKTEAESKTETVESVKKVSAAQYLYNGEVYKYNPEEFRAPVFADRQMATVVEEGNLCGYSKEDGAWVYWYEGSLYWVLDTNVESNRDEELYMFFHLYSARAEDLPENRKQHGFDNKDFVFGKNEILLEKDSLYRVASLKVNEGYTVVSIRTGRYDSLNQKNIWAMKFQMSVWK